MSFLEEERSRDRPALVRPADVISAALGAQAFSAGYWFPRLTVAPRAGHGPRLQVSRFYWGLNPQVVIDFKRDLRFGPEEVQAKEAYFKKLGVKYVLLADQWDVEALREAQSDQQVPLAVHKPMVGPRRKR